MVSRKKKLTRKDKGPSPADKTEATEGKIPELEYLLKHDLPIFLRNNSHPLGDIHIQFVEQASGRRFPIKIPATLLPINVSARVPKAAVNDSIDFRQILQKQMVTTVWPADALRELSEPDAQEELKDLFASKHAGGGGVSKFSADATVADVAREKAVAKKAMDRFDITDDEPFTIDPRVQGVMVQFNEGTLDEKKAARKLKNLAGHLSEDDLLYVRQRASNSPDLRALADKLLASKQKEVNSKKGETTSRGSTQVSNIHKDAVSS